MMIWFILEMIGVPETIMLAEAIAIIGTVKPVGMRRAVITVMVVTPPLAVLLMVTAPIGLRVDVQLLLVLLHGVAAVVAQRLGVAGPVGGRAGVVVKTLLFEGALTIIVILSLKQKYKYSDKNFIRSLKTKIQTFLSELYSVSEKEMKILTRTLFNNSQNLNSTYYIYSYYITPLA